MKQLDGCKIGEAQLSETYRQLTKHAFGPQGSQNMVGKEGDGHYPAARWHTNPDKAVYITILTEVLRVPQLRLHAGDATCS